MPLGQRQAIFGRNCMGYEYLCLVCEPEPNELSSCELNVCVAPIVPLGHLEIEREINFEAIFEMFLLRALSQECSPYYALSPSIPQGTHTHTHNVCV